eukprot:360890-Chlamydomonas_euryale.AAC.1
MKVRAGKRIERWEGTNALRGHQTLFVCRGQGLRGKGGRLLLGVLAVAIAAVPATLPAFRQSGSTSARGAELVSGDPEYALVMGLVLSTVCVSCACCAAVHTTCSFLVHVFRSPGPTLFRLARPWPCARLWPCQPLCLHAQPCPRPCPCKCGHDRNHACDRVLGTLRSVLKVMKPNDKMVAQVHANLGALLLESFRAEDALVEIDKAIVLVERAISISGPGGRVCLGGGGRQSSSYEGLSGVCCLVKMDRAIIILQVGRIHAWVEINRVIIILWIGRVRACVEVDRVIVLARMGKHRASGRQEER